MSFLGRWERHLDERKATHRWGTITDALRTTRAPRHGPAGELWRAR